MHLQRRNAICELFALVIIINLLRSSHEQQQPQPHNAQVTLCAAENNENTLRTFWNEASRNDCPKDPYKLMDLYENIESSESEGKSSSKCNHLLKHSLRKTLIDASGVIFEEALIAQTFSQSGEVQRLAKRLSQLDWRLSQLVWQRTIDAVHTFLDDLALHEELNQLQNLQAKVIALLYLQTKPIVGCTAENKARLKIRRVYFYRDIRQSLLEFNSLPEELLIRVFEAYRSLPADSKHIFNSMAFVNLPVGLWNKQHDGTLYGSLVVGPKAEQLLPLMLIDAKNGSESFGKMYLRYDSNGDVSFGFGKKVNALKFLYVDEDDQVPYIWIGKDFKPQRWWQIRWYQSDGFYTFKNVQTQELLCTGSPVNAGSREIFLHLQMDKFVNPVCRWLFIWSDLVTNVTDGLFDYVL